MSDIFANYYDTASLAFASYAENLSAEAGEQETINNLVDEENVEMSNSQASQFVKRFDILDQLPNTLFGFSATVFQKGDEYYLALRGTEFSGINGVRVD